MKQAEKNLLRGLAALRLELPPKVHQDFSQLLDDYQKEVKGDLDARYDAEVCAVARHLRGIGYNVALNLRDGNLGPAWEVGVHMKGAHAAALLPPTLFMEEGYAARYVGHLAKSVSRQLERKRDIELAQRGGRAGYEAEQRLDSTPATTWAATKRPL